MHWTDKGNTLITMAGGSRYLVIETLNEIDEIFPGLGPEDHGFIFLTGRRIPSSLADSRRINFKIDRIETMEALN